MSKATQRWRAALAAVAAGSLLLAGCTGGDGVAPEPGASSTADTGVPRASSTGPGAAAADPEAIVETLTLTVGGGELGVGVHPLVRSDGHVVLTLDLRPASPTKDGELFLARLLQGEVLPDQAAQGGAIRLLDLEAEEVHLPGIGADGRAVGTGTDLTSVPEDGVRVQRVYAAPGDDVGALGLLLPGAYLPEVPIIDSAVPRPTMAGGVGGSAEPLDPAAVDLTPVLELQRYTRELDGAVRVIESSEQVHVSLGGDVLFDSSSAELRPDAMSAIDAAVRHLEGHSPGEIAVVGHTDDVGDDAANQELSEQRAAAVVAAVSERIDRSAYSLRPSGKGEAEPLVANDSDADRQTNRRVELTLTTVVTTRTVVESEGELPPFDDGPVAKGAEGVEIEVSRPYRVTAPQAVRVGDSLVVTLQVEALDGAVNSSFGPGWLGGVFSYRGDDTAAPQHVLGLTLLSGSTAVYPYDYMLGENFSGKPEWRITGDLDVLRRVDGGQKATFTAVFPGIEGADTVAVQVGQNLGASPFRLTDIPVVMP
jgi:outer membrane protein OmpA-like peptidoglycan-associated protein